MKYYIKISMPVSATECRAIPAEFDSTAKRYWFAEKADEAFLSEYAEFVEAVG